jgi:hypothetical protein
MRLKTVRSRPVAGVFAALVLLVFLFPWTSALAQTVHGPPEVTTEVHHDVSPPLRNIPPSADTRPQREIFIGPLHPGGPLSNSLDPVIQSSAGASVATTPGLGFDGVGNGFVGPQGSFTVKVAPPDTNGAVGASQYVQFVNTSFAVFDKSTGATLYGPAAGSTLWSGFGGPCETTNDGDVIAQYDKSAGRWFMSQLSFSQAPPYYLCIAVSTTNDATGSYNRYAFSYTNLNDYPKIGVWPDAYYASYNMFQGTTTFLGAQICAFDRNAMLAGSAATQQCFQLTSSFGGVLPSDLDGATSPPAGSPNYFLNFGSNSLNLWQFHVSWTNPSSTTLTGPTNIAVAAFSEACSNGGTCIPQLVTPSQRLDSLGDRLMYRLAYRNFGDHEALVVNHSVTAGSSVGVRWYEIRSPATPTVYQQGTYAPDSSYRWMGSIAMDKVGDIAVGYSVSSSSMHPAIRYTGRLPSDILGTLQGETSIIEGAGSQTRNLSRWGDYSGISIDPVDDCTFWYTNEYLKTNGTFNWSTRIASFKFPSCTTAPAAPAGLAATAGNAQVSLTWNASSGATSYNVYRSTTSGGSYVKIINVATASYTNTGLTNGTAYYYVVTAANAGGESAFSNQASATPVTPPAAPTGLAATPGNAQVSLTWSASSGASSYNVYRSTTSGGSYAKIINVATTTYTNTGPTNGTTYYFVVTALNSGGESSFSNQASATPSASVSWSNGYTYRRTITIDHTKVPNTDQTNFPVLISGTYSYLATTGSGNVTNANGYDITFTSDAAGTSPLALERETYNASTGTVNFWVKIPTVSHASDTVIYLFYGNSSITTDQSNKTAVWDSNYQGVWHLNETSGSVNHDSSSNNIDANKNSATSPSPAAGLFGGVQSFNGSSDYETITNTSAIDVGGGNHTASIWFKANSYSSYNTLFTKEGNPAVGSNRDYSFWINTTSDGWWAAGNNSGVNWNRSGFTTGTWHYLVMTRSSNSETAYLDGSSVVSTTFSGTTDSGGNLEIGADHLFGGYYWNGYLGEFRVSNTTRSADWIAAEYNNQNSPSTFYAIGAADSGGTSSSPTITSLSRTSGDVGVSVMITGTNFGSTQGSSTVTFNGTTASPTSWSATSITTMVPTGATTGNVVVTVAGAFSNGVNFTVTASGGWSNGYSYRRAITIDHTKVPNTDQTNFPVLISGTYSYLATTGSGNVTNANGYDITFTSDAAGTSPLALERETYNASTGTVNFWVKIPTVSHASDTVIYLFYGNSSITTDQSNKTAVWDSNYQGVWHLNETSGSVNHDSSSNNIDANKNSATSPSPAAGLFGGVQSFNGSSDYETITNTSAIDVGGGNHTASIWFKANSYSSYNTLFTKEGNPAVGSNRDYSFWINTTSDGWWAAGNNSGVNWNRSGFTTGTWHYLVMTRSSNSETAYLDGSSVVSTTFSGTTDSGGNLEIGADHLFGGYYWNGYLGEFRVSNTTRSADWIAAEYNNQNSPSTFYSVGSASSQ